MIRVTMLRPVLDDDAIYVGDAGHVFCGRHAGHSARHTRRDISGQRVLQVTLAEIAQFRLACEVCRSNGGPA